MKEIVIALVIGFVASKVIAYFTWRKRLRRQASLFRSLTERERGITSFRWDCVNSLVGNTCDNVHDTGNSPDGVSIPEAAAYHLVQASYDPEDVAVVLSEVAELIVEGMAPDPPKWVSEAACWDEDLVKIDGVDMLRELANAEDDTAGRPYMLLPATDVKAREG